ncbi:MAG: hypothetical protein C0625_09600 [Arcobacter sp.]|nr:MAG: hypothetical protein C0625_09600 [Arcobacter sp.]
MIIDKELDTILQYKPNVKEKTSFEDKQIILYGAGAMGQMALDFIDKIDIIPKYFIDKNKKGQVKNIKILSPFDISVKDKENSLFIICIVKASLNEITLELQDFGFKNIIHFYDYSNLFLSDFLTNGWDKFTLSNEEIEKIKFILKKLSHDEISTKHYLQFLWWRLKKIEKVYENVSILHDKKYFNAPCFVKLNSVERYLDVGAHHGTTIQHFLEASNNNFDFIWAIEPDINNFDILKSSITNISSSKISLYNNAISNKEGNLKFIDKLSFASKIDIKGIKEVKTNKIDNLNLNPTIIKLHIEGQELNALKGAKKTIEKHRPIIMVLADHNEDGLYDIPNFLINITNYELFFYLHDYCGNSAIFYAIPKERLF